mmetsp:Transcript_8370/g.26169  ORF Transcript_8370/g.26169 Transcript_8370/m.26169 type:complete len:254 (+) Transcript_8370:1377-2138(+)
MRTTTTSWPSEASERWTGRTTRPKRAWIGSSARGKGSRPPAATASARRCRRRRRGAWEARPRGPSPTPRVRSRAWSSKASATNDEGAARGRSATFLPRRARSGCWTGGPRCGRPPAWNSTPRRRRRPTTWSCRATTRPRASSERTGRRRRRGTARRPSRASSTDRRRRASRRRSRTSGSGCWDGAAPAWTNGPGRRSTKASRPRFACRRGRCRAAAPARAPESSRSTRPNPQSSPAGATASCASGRSGGTRPR